MRSQLFKGTSVALLCASLTPVALAQSRQPQPRNARPIALKSSGVGIQVNQFIYNNTTTYSGSGYYVGASGTVGANTLTPTEMDDIIFPAGYAGRQITEFTFTLANFNTVPVTARPSFTFWLADGTDGGPGTYYDNNGATPFGLQYGATTLQNGFVTSFTSTIDPVQIPFFVPTTGSFWVGMTLDNDSGATGATAAQLSNLGQGLYGIPTIGESDDVFFEATSIQNLFNVSNPAGTFYWFGGGPVNPYANFGYGFKIDANTLSGTINLEGAVDKVQPVTFEFRNASNVTQFTRTVTLGADGSFTLPLIPADTFTISVKGAKWLRETIAGVNLTAGDVTNFTTTLRAGDGNNDNTVDIGDLSLLIPVYNQIEGAPGSTYLDAADFNTDGANDFSDLSLVIGNYNQLGDS